uniref:Uncharacterized protein n=1 Tax=Arundo donax TaxID=35708 RepID=A0A0A8YVX6_ARUDO
MRFSVRIFVILNLLVWLLTMSDADKFISYPGMF